MKYLLAFPLFLFSVFIVATAHAQIPPQPRNLTPTLFCLGSCPTIAVSPKTLRNPTSIPINTTTSRQVSTKPDSSSSTQVPSTVPCSTTQQSVTMQNSGKVQTQSTKYRASTGKGLLQQLVQFLLQLLQLIFKQFNIQIPGTTGGTPQCITPSVMPSISSPSKAPIPTIVNAHPSSAPTPVAGIVSTPQKASSQCAPSSQTITVNGKQWVRTSNNWGGGNVCLNAWDGKSVSYRIDSQNAAPSGGVMAYPDLSQGWNFGGGGATSGWTSKQISALTNPQVTWITSQANAVSGSKYDTGADLWFSTTPNFTNRAAEILISLNNQGEPPSTSKQITLSGVNYYFYVVPQHGWNEIIFARVQPTSSVTNLALLPFFQYCVSQGLLKSSDYFVNAGFGNEIWQLGTGLEVDGISLTE